MSTAIQSIQDQIRQELENVSKTVEKPSGHRVSLKGKAFTLPGGESSAGPMSVIVLDWRNTRLYYKGVYNANKPEPPSCFAINKFVDDLHPSENAPEAQCDTCSECAFNEWGSAPTGKGKACKNGIRVAVVGANPKEDSQVLTLDVSPTSLGSFNSLVNDLASKSLLPIQTLTDISFDAKETFPKLVFTSDAPITDDDLLIAMKLREKAQALLDYEPTGR